MVRVSIKGGIWKNSEDEILKAAIQKYGKQQWARVASLLNRKTAKQAKARWHEWLDPSIKKTTEWSREEEEKLLHLANVLPAQWKTIGPILGGRTATQCQEHYEQLLDQAASASGTATDATDDLRKQTAGGGGLRPGQIDAHPESKPARPDPVDMDEDELEMLQEARARLANTQGKKAKRKQREKMLATAKRLADLQKRRELKQAGLLSQAAASKKYQRALNRRGEIDFGAEIPFHKPAPAGFHDTSAEDARAEVLRQKQMTLVDFKKVNESQYRTRDREAAQAAKRHETRMRVLQDSNEQYAMTQQKRLLQQQEQEQAAARPRMALSLPEPTMTDSEWKDWRKQQQEQQHGGADYATAVLQASSSNNTATAALLGDYTDRPLPTPMRTTATAAAASSSSRSRSNLVEAASRLRQLERGPTPLLQSLTAIGAMEEEEDEKDDEDDRKMPASTLPQRHGVGGRTPTVSMHASRTKVRDELGLNHHHHHDAHHDDDDATTATGAAHSVGASTFASTAHYSTATSKSIRDLARQERRAAKRARQELQDALAALPAPLYEYELAVPETVNDEDDDGVVETIQDRADVEAADRREQERLAQKLYEARSTVLKRADLPRPTKTTALPFLEAIMEKGIAADDDSTNEARRLIQEEMNALLGHDAFQFPVAPPEVDVEASGSKKKKKKRKRNAAEPSWMVPVAEDAKEVVLDEYPEDALNAAKIIIETETALIVQEKMNSIPSTIASTAEARTVALTNANMDSREAAAKDMLYLKSTINEGHGEWIDSPGSEADVLNSLKFQFETLREATEALRQKNDKVESKLAVMNGGYAKRAVKFQKDTLQTFAQWQNAQIEEAVYRQLQSQERQGGALRIESWKRDVAQAKAEEARLQKQYGALVTEKRRLIVAKKRNESS